MYFVSYQKQNQILGGIISPDGKGVISFEDTGKLIDKKLPSSLVEFIECSNQELIDLIRSLLLKTDPSNFTPLDSVTILAPIPKPIRNIICIGKNYQDHINEVKTAAGSAPEKAIYFSKLTGSVIGPDTPILIDPSITQQVDYEAELAVIIGKKGKNIKSEEASSYIFGYMCANDVTARDLQKERGQWFDGKSLDTFCPTGPAILYHDAIAFPPKLDIRCYVNDELRQSSNTGNLIHSITDILCDLSRGITLYPGDILLTGTPAGVGAGRNPQIFLKQGDVVTVQIEHLGQLKNMVI